MSSQQDASACSLPTEKVFSIQIGSELFRLSGASLASDAPSYFSRFFEEQMRLTDPSNVRTLYIDRDPATFREIARHLQGYHIRPQNGAQFVKLFADAQFYSCEICLMYPAGRGRANPDQVPKLISQLFEEEIFMQIGDRHFQIPRDIFSSPGDSPNFFTLGFGAFFASPSSVFPGLDRVGLLRPPSIVAPSVPNRSAEIFAEIIHLLRGYTLHIRDDDHRAALLRDCRYFHLRGLEQRLIRHHISLNPFTQRLEIIVGIEDVRPSGLQFANGSSEKATGALLKYARPFVDETASDLILEIGEDRTVFNRQMQRVNFFGQTKTRMESLVQVVGKKFNLSESQLESLPLKVSWGRETDLTVDGDSDPWRLARVFGTVESDSDEPHQKRQRTGEADDGLVMIKTGQWRPILQQGENGKYSLVLLAVKVDAYTSQRHRNRERNFL
ncbi:hypothetical protein N7470_002684 [Penicillium chermesinum]|nr:hypothetical protein N7470_002684 [Penicillium chermesinum]